MRVFLLILLLLLPLFVRNHRVEVVRTRLLGAPHCRHLLRCPHCHGASVVVVVVAPMLALEGEAAAAVVMAHATSPACHLSLRRRLPNCSRHEEALHQQGRKVVAGSPDVVDCSCHRPAVAMGLAAPPICRHVEEHQQHYDLCDRPGSVSPAVAPSARVATQLHSLPQHRHQLSKRCTEAKDPGDAAGEHMENHMANLRTGHPPGQKMDPGMATL